MDTCLGEGDWNAGWSPHFHYIIHLPSRPAHLLHFKFYYLYFLKTSLLDTFPLCSVDIRRSSQDSAAERVKQARLCAEGLSQTTSFLPSFLHPTLSGRWSPNLKGVFVQLLQCRATELDTWGTLLSRLVWMSVAAAQHWNLESPFNFKNFRSNFFHTHVSKGLGYNPASL